MLPNLPYFFILLKLNGCQCFCENKIYLLLLVAQELLYFALISRPAITRLRLLKIHFTATLGTRTFNIL